jgi:hypothetical protein
MNKITLDISDGDIDAKTWNWLNVMLPMNKNKVSAKFAWEGYFPNKEITYIIYDYNIYKTFLLFFA